MLETVYPSRPFPGYLFRDVKVVKEWDANPHKESQPIFSPSKDHLLCVQCQYKITQENHKITISGKQEFTFFNPLGMVFHIGCFQEASGCASSGSPSMEFSWFPGFAWQIASCCQCSQHLGWLFSRGAGEHFFGLILARLVRGGGRPYEGNRSLE